MKDKKRFVIETIIIVIVFIIGLVGYFLYNRGYFTSKSDNTDTDVVEESKIGKDNEEILKRFITIASYYSDNGYSTTADKFYNGTSSIDKDTRLKMAYNSVYNIDQKVKSDKKLSDNEIKSMTTNRNIDRNTAFVIIKISDFNKAYSDLFQENVSYTLEEISKIGCPMPVGYNKELDRIYLSSECMSLDYGDLDFIIKSYDFDNKYYYVHQEIDVKTGVEESNTLTYKVLWKFDSNFKFISTTKE